MSSRMIKYSLQTVVGQAFRLALYHKSCRATCLRATHRQKALPYERLGICLHNSGLYLFIAIFMIVMNTNALGEEIIKSPLLRERCGTCHDPNGTGHYSRIEHVRKTPEGWKRTLQRMQKLHDVEVDEEETEELIKELCQHLMLTPEEMNRISYIFTEKDLIEEVPNEDVKKACAGCHSYAFMAAQRRTRDEWSKLRSFHLAVHPPIVYQLREIDWASVSKKALDYLSEKFPFNTQEWEDWRRKDIKERMANIGGIWKVAGFRPGKGDYEGIVDFKKNNEGEYHVVRRIKYLDGTTEEWLGKGVLFGGYSLRTYFKTERGYEIKGVFNLSDDKDTLKGSWRFINKPHIKGEEEQYRETQDTKILKVIPPFLRRGSHDTTLRLLGWNLPSLVEASDIQLGKGIVVKRILEANPDSIQLKLDILKDAPMGKRDLVLAGKVNGKWLFYVYEKIDYIKVSPEYGLARIGGVTVPSKGVQFVAMGFSNGPDNIPYSKDDINLGYVHARWHLEEYYSSHEDDDIKFVGNIDETGLFIPNKEGPNPNRPGSFNNAGNVWVVATYMPEGSTKPLKAKAYLLVTIPVYLRQVLY